MSHVKRVIQPYHVFNNTSIVTSPTSEESDVTNLDYARYDITWGGSSPVATLEVQYLADGETAWQTLNVGTISISGTSGSHEVILTLLPFKKLRLRVNYTSGTGVIHAILTAKES